MDDLSRPIRQSLTLHSSAEFANNLSAALGEKTASSEVQRALDELQFDQAESRPYALRRLRGRIEANLSGLLGPAVAHSIINRSIPFQPNLHGSIEDINLIERNLDRAQINFTGLAARYSCRPDNDLRLRTGWYAIGLCRLALGCPDGQC